MSDRTVNALAFFGVDPAKPGADHSSINGVCFYSDIEQLQDGEQITLHPNQLNLLHSKPVRATYSSGYFYCEGTDPIEGPDYYFRDVLAYNHGWSKGW